MPTACPALPRASVFAGCARSILLALSLAIAGCAPGADADARLGNTARRDVAPGQAGVNIRLARASRIAGDLASSVQIYRGLAEDRSAAPEVLVEAADCLVEAGLHDEAIEIYGRVGGTARPEALRGLVRAHMALGETAPALKAADAALALTPRDARVLVNRGAVLDALQRHPEAQASYRAALEIAPHSVAARNNLALSLALVGQYDEAIGLMGPLARTATATPKIRENLALIYGLSGDTERAASTSRVDLDEIRTAENLAFFARLRGSAP